MTTTGNNTNGLSGTLTVTYTNASGNEASETVTITVDDQFTAETDVIDTIQFLVDNCYGDDNLRSGDIDIVSVSVA